MNTIKINDIEYIPLSEVKKEIKLSDKVKWLTKCIVRTYSAGVWAGYVDLKKVNEVMTIKEARRLWKWNSQFTLSELAQKWFWKSPDNNKYAIPVTEVFLTNVIEIIPTSDISMNQIINAKNYGE